MLPSSNNEFIYVPLPPRLLPAFHQWLATMMEQTDVEKRVPASTPDILKRNRKIIDLSIDAAHEIGADQSPVSLADLHAAYLHANPGISKGKTLDSFGATINFHTINMPSRFPEPSNPCKPASWLSRPVFKRVAYGQYMLLSPHEIRLFHQRIEEGDQRIYRKEYYDLDDLFSASA